MNLQDNPRIQVWSRLRGFVETVDHLTGWNFALVHIKYSADIASMNMDIMTYGDELHEDEQFSIAVKVIPELHSVSVNRLFFPIHSGDSYVAYFGQFETIAITGLPKEYARFLVAVLATCITMEVDVTGYGHTVPNRDLYERVQERHDPFVAGQISKDIRGVEYGTAKLRAKAGIMGGTYRLTFGYDSSPNASLRQWLELGVEDPERFFSRISTLLRIKVSDDPTAIWSDPVDLRLDEMLMYGQQFGFKVSGLK